MSMNKSSKLLSYINWRIRVVLEDGRHIVGLFMAFDRHMNLILGDCEEFRLIRKKRGSKMIEELEQKRTLGLILLRGENVVSIQGETPPAPQKKPEMPLGPGAAMAAGRGMPIPPVVVGGPLQANPALGSAAPGHPMLPGGGRGGMMPPGAGGNAPHQFMAPPGFLPPPGYGR